MKRLVLFLATTVLGTGCYVASDPAPTGTLDVTWAFVRTLHGGTTATPYSCALAGIDSVAVTSSVGFSQSFACHGTFDGAVFDAPAGSQRLTMTGYRGAVALYQSAFDVTVTQNGTSVLYANVYGIPDDLDIYALFRGYGGADMGWSTCASAGVAILTWNLQDWAGTIVDSGSVACTNPAGLSYAGAAALDRDQYVIRMQGFPPVGLETFDSATTNAVNGCAAQKFNHYGPNVVSPWNVILYDVSLNTSFCP